MTIALGLWFAFGVGVADYHGGFIAKRSHALATVATALVAGVVTMSTLMVLFVHSELVASDVLLGVCSGSLIGFALASLYQGMAVSSAAVVAPIAATLASVIPFVWDLATGGTLAGLAVVGALVAFVGLVLSTVSPELGDRVKIGVFWGLIAGICFGASLTFLGETSEDSGLWPAVVQRSTAFVALAVTATARREPVLVPRSLWARAAVSGALGASAIAAFTVGSQRGSLAEIAAITALAPAITAIMSAVFDGHVMRWWQVVGAVVCAGGVALIGVA
ncbi:MAG: DMT family transporter [Actinomycetota bacterium]